MKRLLLALFVLSASVSVSFGQTINDANVQKRQVGSFHGIEVSTGIELKLTNGNIEEVAVSAASTEFRDKIITRVENGILKIYYENKMKAPNTKRETKSLKAYVSYKTLSELNANTGAEVEIVGMLQSTSLKINANTGATIDGKISSDKLKVSQNTGSVISLSGDAANLEVEGDTGSKFKSEELVTAICFANVSTGAKIDVTATKELSVKASTGGSVKYKGGASLNVKKSTGGNVSKI
jgi:hypothetical protein